MQEKLEEVDLKAISVEERLLKELKEIGNMAKPQARLK